MVADVPGVMMVPRVSGLPASVRRISGCLGTLTAVAALAACAHAASTAPLPADAAHRSPESPAAQCSTADVQFLLGKTVDERIAQEARRRAHARVVRVLRPGQMATLEFNPARLNLRTDAQGMVVSVDCG